MFKKTAKVHQRKALRSPHSTALGANKTRELLIAGVIGVVGAMIGSYVTANIQSRNELRKQQAQQLRDGLVQRSYPDAYSADMGGFMEAVQALSVVSDTYLRDMAALRRKFPDCYIESNYFLERCKSYIVGVIAANRKEAGVAAVSPEDIEVAIASKYLAARQAKERRSRADLP